MTSPCGIKLISQVCFLAGESKAQKTAERPHDQSENIAKVDVRLSTAVPVVAKLHWHSGVEKLFL